MGCGHMLSNEGGFIDCSSGIFALNWGLCVCGWPGCIRRRVDGESELGNVSCILSATGLAKARR